MSKIQYRLRIIGLGLALSVLAGQAGLAQTMPSYSTAASQQIAGLGPTGLTTLPGQNGAQQAMAQSINNVCPTITTIAKTPDQQNLATICQAMTLNALQVQNQPNPLQFNTSFGLNGNQLNGALQQLNGGAELLVPTSQASVVQTTQTSRQTGAIEQRLKELRNGAAMTVTADAGSSGITQLAEATAPGAAGATFLAQNQPPATAYSIGRLGVFANGLGQFGSRDMTTTENGYTFNNGGFIVGADYRFIPQLVAGLAFGYSQSATSFDTSALSQSGQSLNGNLLQGNLYATYSITDALYVNAIGYVGGGNNNSQRRIVFGTVGPNTIALDDTATGSFASRVGGVTLAAGYDMPLGLMLLTPIARLLYQHTGVDAFSEEGAMGANLQYGGSSVNTVVSFLGADGQYRFNTALGPLYPIARFHWAHQYNPENTAVSVAYSNDPSLLSSFTLPGTPTSRNYFDLGVGISLQLAPAASAFINYDLILGLSNTSYNSFTAGIRMNF